MENINPMEKQAMNFINIAATLLKDSSKFKSEYYLLIDVLKKMGFEKDPKEEEIKTEIYNKFNEKKEQVEKLGTSISKYI